MDEFGRPLFLRIAEQRESVYICSGAGAGISAMTVCCDFIEVIGYQSPVEVIVFSQTTSKQQAKAGKDAIKTPLTWNTTKRYIT